jgi:hypothetical protein
MSLVAGAPQPTLAWQFQSSNVDSVVGLAPNLSTTGTYAAPTGGTITTVGANRIHTFTSGTTTITFLVPVTAQVLVVAGGGGGGGTGTTNQTGGGGGAGELYYNASYSIAPGTYTVTVGAAGTRGLGSGSTGGTPTNGGDSIFGPIDCNGGGRGGSSSGLDNGGSGGSGGGASRNATGGASVKTAGGFGNAGGISSGSLSAGEAGGGGGGGAGGAGAAAGPTNDTRAAGGAGRAYSISGVSVTYAQGGRGGSRNGTSDGPAGTTNAGDGGGGGDGNAVSNGGNGGAGIVIISYNAALYPSPTYVAGKYLQAINFNNTVSATGSDPNCYVTYDVSAFNLTSNSSAMSLWINSGMTYPITTGASPVYINLQGTNYNFIYTASATSNISFRIGSRPLTLGNAVAQTAVWQHHCAVFSNVGAGASNTITSYYVNGSLVAIANNTIQSFSTLNIGCENSGTNGALCSIDDVRLFRTPLTAPQIQAIYRAQGMPSASNWNNRIGASKSYFTKSI